MYAEIQKRDGRVVPFEVSKIASALTKAGTATEEFGESVAKKLAQQVVRELNKAMGSKTPTVEDVQNAVEAVLLGSPYRETAKAYIIYREKHAELRVLADKQYVDLMDQYLDNLDWQVAENSNMSYSLQGLNNYIASEVSKRYWLHKVYPPEIKKVATSGDLHIHDLNTLSSYCVGWDLQDLVGSPGTELEFAL